MHFKNLVKKNWEFIKGLLIWEFPDVPENDSWKKMKDEALIDGFDEISVIPKKQDGIYEADLYRELNLISAIIDESVEFYLTGDVNKPHKFSWEDA